jgi:RNA polymerase sigma factor (sigma-70 family)
MSLYPPFIQICIFPIPIVISHSPGAPLEPFGNIKSTTALLCQEIIIVCKLIYIKGSFKAYPFQSVHYHALNAIRQQKTGKDSVNLITPEKTWKFISDNYRIDNYLIENIVSDETEAIIEHIIKELPDQCSKVFLRSRFESLKNEEIAAQLGLSENTVKTHIYRALQKIASALKTEK